MAKKTAQKGTKKASKEDKKRKSKLSKSDKEKEYELVPPLMIAKRMLTSGNIIWRKNDVGIKVQQLFSEYYTPVIDMLQFGTSLEEPMCVLLQLYDKWKPIEEMLNKATKWMDNCTSFVAIEEASGIVCGTLIGRIICNNQLMDEMEELKRIKEELKLQSEENKDDSKKSGAKNHKGKANKKGDEIRMKTQSAKSVLSTKGLVYAKRGTIKKVLPRVDPPEDIIPVEEPKKEPPICMFDDDYEGYKSEALTRFLKYRCKLFETVDVFEECDVRCYYKIYVFAVSKAYQRKGIGSMLMDAALTMCTELHIALIVSLFTSLSSQMVARKLGFMAVTSSCLATLNDEIELENEKEALLMIKYLPFDEIETYLPKPEEETPKRRESITKGSKKGKGKGKNESPKKKK